MEMESCASHTAAEILDLKAVETPGFPGVGFGWGKDWVRRRRKRMGTWVDDGCLEDGERFLAAVDLTIFYHLP